MGTLEGDLICCLRVKTKYRTLILVNSETQVREKTPSLPSVFRAQDGSEIAVHFPIDPKEKKKE